MVDPPVVAHGFTLNDLHKLALTAYNADRLRCTDSHTRYDLAFSAIALALCEAEEPPTRRELVRAGLRALYEDVDEVGQLYGFRYRIAANGMGSAPRFATYWSARENQRRIEDDLIDKLAVWQILSTLTKGQRAAIVALAALDNYQAAATFLKLGYAAFSQQLLQARRRFRTHWFAPETAPPVTTRDVRVGSKILRTHCSEGHELSGENVYRRPGRKGRGERTCRTCEAERNRARWLRKKAADVEGMGAG